LIWLASVWSRACMSKRSFSSSRASLRVLFQTFSGTVMQNLPQAEQSLASTLGQSQAASGNLDALQAQTQVQAQSVGQLVAVNAQLAALAQAQADRMSFDLQSVDDARRLAADAMNGFLTPSSAAALSGAMAFH
jgi:conjugal transfer/entry exclusion protein